MTQSKATAGFASDSAPSGTGATGGSDAIGGGPGSREAAGTKVLSARALATLAHRTQRYGHPSLPYLVHLGHVAAVLARFDLDGDEDLLAAAWLHDAMEDAGVTRGEIVNACGAEAARLVQAVTDAPGRNRAERHVLTYPRIRDAGEKGINLKLADRIANIEACILGRDARLRMYAEEHREFHAALVGCGGDRRMWQHLAEMLGPVAEAIRVSAASRVAGTAQSVGNDAQRDGADRTETPMRNHTNTPPESSR